jgi:hypothetical protein
MVQLLSVSELLCGLKPEDSPFCCADGDGDAAAFYS